MSSAGCAETDVAIREGKIAAIGKLSEEEWTAATVLDGTGKALFPGMQNLHVHIFQSLLKGLGADLNLIEWLKAAPLRGGPAMTDSLQRLACKIAAMESLKCGVTTLSVSTMCRITMICPTPASKPWSRWVFAAFTWIAITTLA